MEDQLLFENLDEKLEDENGFITANWLSITFDVNIDESRRVMASYIRARDSLSSVYLLTGISSQGDILVKMVNSEQISLAEKSFLSPPKRVVYSIQRQKCKDSLSLACYDLLHDISESQLKRLVSIPWEPSKKSFRAPLSCRENQEHVQQTTQQAEVKIEVPTLPKVATIGHDEKIKTSNLKNFFNKAEKPVQIARKDFNLDSKNKIPPKPTENRKPKEAAMTEEDEEIGPKNTHLSQKRKRIVIESDEEDEENTESGDCKSSELIISKVIPKRSNKSVQKTQNSYKKDKEKVLASDSEADSFVAEPTKLEKSPNKMKKINVKVLSTPNKLEVNSKNSEKSTELIRPNRIRHQVMKTFADEDGFMVTEKGWESASDDEIVKPVESSKVDSNQNGKNQPSLQMEPDKAVLLTASPTVLQTKLGKQLNKKV
ncbi:unnamed protein product [Heterobilharzia americana]|nr:unnamed protein product [Heterobilharzia americana]